MTGRLWAALGLHPGRHRAVTLVGAGGKTTLLHQLAGEVAAAGGRAILTTTTHIRPPRTLPLAGDVEELARLLREHSVVVLGVPRGEKLRGVGQIGVCKELGTVLIEGDGARMRPLKAPAAHEPVIPAESDAVVAVAGLTALGGSIAEVCHRPESVCAILHKTPADIITSGDIAALLTAPAGGRKGVGAGMLYRCALHQADASEAGPEIAKLLRAQGVAHVAVTEITEEGMLCWS